MRDPYSLLTVTLDQNSTLYRGDSGCHLPSKYKAIFFTSLLFGPFSWRYSSFGVSGDSWPFWLKYEIFVFPLLFRLYFKSNLD